MVVLHSIMTRCLCIQNDDELDLIDDADNASVAALDGATGTTEHAAGDRGRCSSRASSYRHTESEGNSIEDTSNVSLDDSTTVRYNSLMDNSTSHILNQHRPYACQNRTVKNSLTHDKTPLGNILNFFRLRRARYTPPPRLSTLRSPLQENTSRDLHINQSQSGEYTMYSVPSYSRGNTAHVSGSSPYRYRKEMSTTQSIEKLCTSRRDNPVYSRLPQQDPSDPVPCLQDVHPHPGNNDDADWIKDATPLEHSMLIRSPPPIKRHDSPMKTCYEYANRNGAASHSGNLRHNGAGGMGGDDSEGGGYDSDQCDNHQITTIADVCINTSDYTNDNIAVS